MTTVGSAIPDIILATRAAEGMLDLTAPRHSAWQAMESLSGEDRESYLKTMADLLRAGVVGIETLEVDGHPYTRFAELAIGDDAHRGDPQYRRQRLDVRA